MRHIGPVGAGLTVLVVVVLVAGGTAAGLPADSQGVQTERLDDSTAASESPTAMQDDGEVELALTPAAETVEPGETASYNLTVLGPDSGLSAYWLNVTVADPDVAEIDGYELDREDPEFDTSFVTEDNSTLVLEVGLGDDTYDPTEEVTIATVDIEAVGEAGESTALEMEYISNEAVMDNDFGMYEVTDDHGGTVTMDGPPEVLVSDLEPATAEVVEGELVNVSAVVENVGGAGSQTVTLDVGSVSDEQTVTLDDGASETVAFDPVDTAELGTGEYEHTVSSDNDSVSGTLTVLAPAEFAVEITGTNTPVAGEDLAVTATVENVGEVAATQTVGLAVGDLGENSTDVTLAGGESTEETLSVSTGEGDAGEYTATATTADDEDSTTVTVLAPALFEVAITDIEESVVEGETVTVAYEVENTGGVEETQDSTFEVDGTVEDTEELTLTGGETFVGEFSYETGSDDGSAVNVTVSSGDDTDSATVAIVEPSAFTVEIVETNAPLVAGEDLAVTVVVENPGTVADERSVEGEASALGTDEVLVDLDGGESTEVTLTFESDPGQTGAHTVTVAVDDEAETAAVELHPAPLSGNDAPPQDLNGDGRYEDIDGDGEFTIFDVQNFFNAFDSETVEQHEPAFDFNDDADISIFDVQALFNLLADWSPEAT